MQTDSTAVIAASPRDLAALQIRWLFNVTMAAAGLLIVGGGLAIAAVVMLRQSIAATLTVHMSNPWWDGLTFGWTIFVVSGVTLFFAAPCYYFSTRQYGVRSLLAGMAVYAVGIASILWLSQLAGMQLASRPAPGISLLVRIPLERLGPPRTTIHCSHSTMITLTELSAGVVGLCLLSGLPLLVTTLSRRTRNKGAGANGD